MHQTVRLLFAHTDGVKVLEARYSAGQLAMAFVLPDAIDGLDAVESRISPGTLTSWMGALEWARVKVALPRFEIDRPTRWHCAASFPPWGCRSRSTPAGRTSPASPLR